MASQVSIAQINAELQNSHSYVGETATIEAHLKIIEENLLHCRAHVNLPNEEDFVVELPKGITMTSPGDHQYVAWMRLLRARQMLHLACLKQQSKLQKEYKEVIIPLYDK